MIFAPKGGVGKTTFATNLAVAAAAAGLRVAGLDSDTQRHFALWGRERTDRNDAGTLRSITVRAAHIKDWREEVRMERQADVIVMDTPPRADGDVAMFLQEIGEAADFVVMPIEVYGASIRFVIQFMSWWKGRGSESGVFGLHRRAETAGP